MRRLEPQVLHLLISHTVIELGAGCALPSLLASTLADPPSIVVVTDYPDETILGTLKQNIARNAGSVVDRCVVHCVGYEWGTDRDPLLYAYISLCSSIHPHGHPRPQVAPPRRRRRLRRRDPQ